ncbi:MULTISPECIES: hypothetical protein [Winogradskyella]|uniref:hypothetical protein n=1 Tax=Winogradskyella TaxID=286104 RepID=UPI0015C9D7F4|nr:MULTISPECIES: hypothetical protein [Winogradskyella]QXP78732.1 hypothetical protein H0I32_16240 [Winogradskyella sp. HaHa_3_26]
MRLKITLLLIFTISNTILSQQLNYPSDIFSEHNELLYKNKDSFGIKGKIKSISAYETKPSIVKMFDGKKIKYYDLTFDESGKLVNKSTYKFNRANDLNYSLKITKNEDSIQCDFFNFNGVIYKKIINLYGENKKLKETETLLTFKKNTYKVDVKRTFEYYGDSLIKKMIYKKKDDEYILEEETMTEYFDSLNYSYKKYKVHIYGNVSLNSNKPYKYSGKDVTIKDSLGRTISYLKHQGLNPNTFEYDKYGKVVKEKYGYTNLAYKYDEKQRLIEKDLGVHTSEPKQLYFYNDKNEQIHIKQVRDNGTTQFEQKIKYDEKGNWKEFIFYQDGKISAITTFEIEYYE